MLFSFSSRHIWKLLSIFFLRLLFLKGIYFTFSFVLFALLNSCFNLLSLFYNLSQSTLYLWNSVAVPFLAKLIAGIRPGLFQKHYAVCDGMLGCFQLSRGFVLPIFNFFRPLSFYLV